MKKTCFLNFTLLIFLLAGLSCSNSNTKKTDKTPKPVVSKTESSPDILGNYVSEIYTKREEGYDWLAVQVSSKGEDKIGIKIRSRADKKKPSCTFDAIAFKKEDNVYQTLEQGKSVLISFAENKVHINTESDSDQNVLDFYCSGGGSFIGSYSKLEEKLDRSQLDPTLFSKYLQLQGIGFSIQAIEKGNETLLTVTPNGLEIVNRPETSTIYGLVTDAEVGDLNADGSPEVLVYVHSKGSGTYGDVIAYSVNNRKSMSRIYFQPVAENQKINDGYMGHDEFSLIENYLGHRFPIYKEDDTNANPTGGIRQVTYELVDGEASRRFEVKKIDEYK